MYRSKLSGFIGAIMMLASTASAAPQDGDATVHIGPIRWTKDSIGNFSASNAGNVVLLGRIPDGAVIAVDPMTGEERRRLPGFIRATTIACSPDGQLCMMGRGVIESDSTPTTLLYNVADGHLLWQKKENIRVLAMSAKLDRVLVKFNESPGSELRSLSTGETIQQYSSIIEYAFMDEWHQRVYVSTGTWDGAIGTWTVELDASSGQELNKWGLETYGPMARFRDSDTLLIYGQDMRRPEYKVAKVLALNVKSGARGPIIYCREDVSNKCDCIGWSALGQWVLAPDGRNALLQQARSQINSALIARRILDGQIAMPECYIHEDLMWKGGALLLSRELIDEVNMNLYYLPDGPRDQFYVRSIGPTLSAPDSNQAMVLSVGVAGSILYIGRSSTATGEAVVSIADMSGRVVKRMVTVLDGRPASVSVADLPAGSYLCSLESGMVTMTGKFMLVR